MSPPVSAGHLSTLRNIGRAVFTVAPFMLHHLWRRRRIDESTQTVDRLREPPPTRTGDQAAGDQAAGDQAGGGSEVQTAADGVGPMVMRSYEVRITGAALGPAAVMRVLLERPGELNDDRIAAFVRDDRPATDLRVGDELVVELPGPWNGPVRVVRADDDELLLQTLDGHMEAGHIRFDTTDHVERPGGGHDFTFRIRSWARGGDRAFTVLHLGLRIAKELQTAMWVAMCEGAVRVSGGARSGRIGVLTDVLAESSVGAAPSSGTRSPPRQSIGST